MLKNYILTMLSICMMKSMNMYPKRFFLQDGDEEYRKAESSIGAIKEVGYALKHVKTSRMLFYFQASEKCTSVPFDVSHLNYVPIVDSAEIKTSVKTRIENILGQARNGEI